SARLKPPCPGQDLCCTHSGEPNAQCHDECLVLEVQAEEPVEYADPKAKKENDKDGQPGRDPGADHVEGSNVGGTDEVWNRQIQAAKERTQGLAHRCEAQECAQQEH